MADPRTVELGVTQPPGEAAQPRTRRRLWRGVTGALVAGWVVTAVAVLGAQIFAWSGGGEGPGRFAVIGHLVGAGLCLAAQCTADRSRGRSAASAGAVVALLTVALLWLFWYS